MKNLGHVVAIIQARMGSTRCPGKIIHPLGGRAMILRQVDRILRSKHVNTIVLATTRSPIDDVVVELGSLNSGFSIFRGDEDDVLNRYYEAAKIHQADTIVRLTGDCPLADPQVIDQCLEIFASSEISFCTNVLPPSFPDGIDVSVFPFQLLESAHQFAELTSEREHVVPWMWKQLFGKGGDLSWKNLTTADDYSHLRLTVDYENDLRMVETLFHRFGEAWETLSWQEAADYLANNPEIVRLSEGTVRDSGYARSVSDDKIWKKLSV